MSSRQKANLSYDLLPHLEEAVIVLDEAGLIQYANPGAEIMMAAQVDQLLGQPIDEYIHLTNAEGKFWRQVAGVHGLQRVEAVPSAGKAISLSLYVKPYSPVSVQSPHKLFLLVIRDVTEVGSAQRLRSYFLANVSHEFRTPLSAMSASVELLLEDLAVLSKDEIAQLLQSIHYSVVGLQTLIDNLLESTSIEAGYFKIRPTLTPVQGVVSEATQVMKPLLARRRQNLITVLPEAPLRASIDPARITQVIVNLLSNASKYSPMDTEIQVLVNQVESGKLRVEIIDQGQGLSQYDQKHLFRRFVRQSEQSGIQYGAGLGLSVVKAIIDAHAGEVGVSSTGEGGSNFWFEVPCEVRVK